jgi:hypothetical protein
MNVRPMWNRLICDYSMDIFIVCYSATKNFFTEVQVLALKPRIVFKFMLISEMLALRKTLTLGIQSE